MAFPCDFATSHMPSQTANEAAQTCPQHACKSKDERRQGRREHRQIAQPHTPSSIPAVPPRSSANGRPSARRQRLGKTPAPSSTTPILYYNTTSSQSAASRTTQFPQNTISRAGAFESPIRCPRTQRHDSVALPFRAPLPRSAFHPRALRRPAARKRRGRQHACPRAKLAYTRFPLLSISARAAKDRGARFEFG